MKQVKAMLAIVFGVAFILVVPAALLIGLAMAAKWVLTQLFAMKPEALEVWLPSLATLFGGGAAVLITKRLERKQDQALRRRDLRSHLYDPIMKMLFELLATARQEGVTAAFAPYQDRILESGRQLLLGGSDEAIQHFVKLQTFNWETGTVEELADLIARVILTMRVDLGYTDSAVGQGTVFRLFRLTQPAPPAGSTPKKAGFISFTSTIE